MTPTQTRARLSTHTVLALLLVFGIVTTVGAGGEYDDWIRLESENFVVLSNAGKRRAAKIVRKLEQLREVLAETSKGMTLHSPLPTTIYVFKNTASFDPYNLGQDGTPAEISGYFVRALDGNYVAVDASAETLPYAVIFHEYLHYVLENSIPAIPLWLNEGIAEFYGTFQVKGGRAEIGLPVPEHLWWLFNHDWMPLQTMFEVDTASAEYSEGERQGTFYAQSWLLAHHLLVTSGRRERMGELLGLLGQGVPSAEAFGRVFEIDLPTAGKELVEHLSNGSDIFYRYTPEAAFDDVNVESARLAPHEAAYHLGDLLAHNSPVHSEAAERHLRRALELDERFVDAYTSSLAMLRLAQDRPAEAAELCIRALSLDADHGRSLVLHGVSLLEQYVATLTEDSARPETTPPLLLQARERFRARLEQSPDQIGALAELGRTYLFDRQDLQPGIDAMARVAKAWPARKDVLAGLIVLTARSGNIDGALSLLDRGLRPRGDREMTRWAEAEIAALRINEAQALIEAGEVDRALETARQAAANVSDPEIHGELTTWIANVSTAKQAGGVQSGMEQVQSLIEAGEIDAALALARETADQTSDPEIRRSVTQWIASVSAAYEPDMLRRQAYEASLAGDAERARELLERVAAMTEHGDAAEAELQMYNRAVNLANSGQPEPAAELFDQLAGTAVRPDLRVQSENLARELRQRIAYSERVDRFNSAVGLVNDGQFHDARPILVALIDESADDELGMKAARILREIERIQKP